MQRRMVQLPLHEGRAPRWLFDRMTRLAGAVIMILHQEYGAAEILRRLADPWWFQAFGCALGFDWHSSGLTTVTCGALKEAQKRLGDDFGLFVAGGKGRTSRFTPSEIESYASRLVHASVDDLIFASRMSAKVDSAAVQDGYTLYHHTFFFSQEGQWCVIQQGMNPNTRWARRYHWLGERVEDFVCEPHAGFHDTQPHLPKENPSILNMVAQEAASQRQACTLLVHESPDRLIKELSSQIAKQTFKAPAGHWILPEHVNLARLNRILQKAHEAAPPDFKTLLGVEGVGPATIRSLSLLAELLFNAPPSHRDPTTSLMFRSDGRSWVDYSYAHGGKDGTPFPVDRKTYDTSIRVLMEAFRRAKAGDHEKTAALRRLSRFLEDPNRSPTA